MIEKLGITPGPWKQGHFANGVVYVYIGGDDVNIAITHGSNGGTNARLIAQAPAMLEALIGMCVDMETYGNSWGNGIDIIESATGKTWDEIKEAEL